MTGEAATVGTLVGGPAGTFVGGIVDAVVSFLHGLKGKTPHISWGQANNVTTPLKNAIVKIISSGTPDLLSLGSDLNNGNFATAAADAIDRCGWWKVGNDQESGIPAAMRSDPNVDGTIWRVLMWAFRNVPSNNFGQVYDAVTEIFNKSLYPILNKSNSQVVKAVDITLAGAVSRTPGAATVSTSSSGSGSDNIITKVSDALGSIFNGVSNSQSNGSSTVKAGFSAIQIVLIAGTVLFVIYNLIKKGKPF